MRRLLLVLLLAISLGIHANDTLRVGQQVLTAGDPVTHVIDLLGTPVFKEPYKISMARMSASAGNTSVTAGAW